MASGTFSRMVCVLRAEVDDFLTRLEDPKKMVRQLVLDMEDTLDDAMAAVGRAVANEKMLEKQLSVKKEAEQVWQKKAESAMEAGEEELARKALLHNVAVTEVIASLEQGVGESREVSAVLKKRLGELKVKLASAKTRQASLVIRKSAGMSRTDGHNSAGVLNSGAFTRYDQFCRDVNSEEIAAEVYAEIAGNGTTEWDEAFDKLENKKKVDAEIEALKSKTRKQS
jgi:phage shock protein A